MTISSEMHSLTGVYVLDSLPDDEREVFERHLRVCVSCFTEVHQFLGAVEALACAAACEPATVVRERILARIQRMIRH